MSERSEERELTALESALRELRPRPEAINRAVLMYRAGRAASHRWLWPLAVALMATLAMAFGVFLLIRPAPAVVEHIVYLPAPAVEPEPPSVKVEESVLPPAPEPLVMEPLDSSPRGRYLRMQENVLRWGLDGIPPPPPAAPLEKMPTIEQLLHSL